MKTAVIFTIYLIDVVYVLRIKYFYDEVKAKFYYTFTLFFKFYNKSFLV